MTRRSTRSIRVSRASRVSRAGLMALALVPRGATAQEPLAPLPPSGEPAPPAAAPVAPPPPAYVPTVPALRGEPSSETPDARRGFQLAVRPGVALPFGTAVGGRNQADVYTPQYSTTLDAGATVIPHLFVGGYLGASFGGAKGTRGNGCETDNATCTATTVRLGVEAEYHLRPARRVDPWLGYGIGYEWSTVHVDQTDLSKSRTLRGPELAHLMGGVDWRLSKIFGVGPFVDVDLGRYTHVKLDSPTRVTSIDVNDRTTHVWLTLGVKFVFFP